MILREWWQTERNIRQTLRELNALCDSFMAKKDAEDEEDLWAIAQDTPPEEPAEDNEPGGGASFLYWKIHLPRPGWFDQREW